MQITATRTALLSAMQRVQNVAEKRNTIPILANALIEVKDGQVTLTGTDMEIAVTATLDAISCRDGGTTVPAAMLYEIVRRLPDCTIEMEASDGRMKLVAGKFTTDLITLPANDFPMMTAGKFATTFTMPTQTLASMIKRSAFAMSSEETRYTLNGMYLHAGRAGERTVLRSVATDGHRLARIDAEMPEGAKGMPGVIVPRKSVNEIGKLIDGSETVEISMSDTRLMVRTKGCTLVTKLIDGTFPEYERVIPQENGSTMSMSRRDLSAVVARVSAITTEKARPIKLTVSTDALTVSMISPEMGMANETLDDGQVKYDADPIEIGMQGRYVTDIIENIGDVVEFRFADPMSPIVITEKDKDDALFILMPLRL